MKPDFKIQITRPFAGVVWERNYSPEAWVEAVQLLQIYRNDSFGHKYTLRVQEIKER